MQLEQGLYVWPKQPFQRCAFDRLLSNGWDEPLGIELPRSRVVVVWPCVWMITQSI